MERSRLSYDNKGFLIDNERIFIYSGEMHHFRVHPELWKDRFIRMKRAFLNCTGAYFYWPIIEPIPGKFIFKGFSDIEQYFKKANEMGLYTIPRPGPYICAEVNAGGHPHCLYSKVKNVRSFDSNYLKFAREYYKHVNEILGLFDIQKGSLARSNIMYQVENEMFSRYVEGGNPEYHLKLRDMVLKQYGDTIPVVTNENQISRGTKVYDTIDKYPNPWDTGGIVEKVRQMLEEQSEFPCFGMEIEGGWFAVYGKGNEEDGYSYRGHMSADWTNFYVKLLLGAGMSGINYYMYHGGTNFGWNGGKYITTTYDYQAPISEWGGLSKRYYVTKLIGSFLSSFGGILTKMSPDEDFLMGSYENTSAKERKKKPYCLVQSLLNHSSHSDTKSSDSNDAPNSAFIFLFNESDVDKQFQVVRKHPSPREAQRGPLEKISLPAKSAKIIPYNLSLDDGLILRYSTLEPYLKCAIEGKTVLLFHGKTAESLNATLEVNGEVHHINGIVQHDEDLYWRISDSLLVGLTKTYRAKRTWLIEHNGNQYPIISNLYLLYDYKSSGGEGYQDTSYLSEKKIQPMKNISIQFHQKLKEEEIRLSLPWFNEVKELKIDDNEISTLYDAQKGVSIVILDPHCSSQSDFDVSLEMVQHTKTIALGDSGWYYKSETCKIPSDNDQPTARENEHDISYLSDMKTKKNSPNSDLKSGMDQQKNVCEDAIEVSKRPDDKNAWKSWVFNQTAEDLQFYDSGYTVYATTFSLPKEVYPLLEKGLKIILHIPMVIDNAIVIINNKFAGYLTQHGSIDISHLLDLDRFANPEDPTFSPSTQQIKIFVERMGYYNHGKREMSGLICGPYLEFSLGGKEIGKAKKDQKSLPLKFWNLKVNPGLKISNISSSLPETQPNYHYGALFEDGSEPSEIKQDENKTEVAGEQYEWDGIEISPGKHKGIGVVPKPMVVFYRTEIALSEEWENKSICLEIERLVGRAWIFINGQKILEYSMKHEKSRTDTKEYCGVHIPREILHFGMKKKNSIVIVSWVESGGDGIHDKVSLNAYDMKVGDKWMAKNVLDGQIEKIPQKSIGDIDSLLKETDQTDWGKVFSFSDLPPTIESMLWVKTSLVHYKTDELWAPKYLELKNIPGKVLIWWNGQLIGRYWDIGPQTKFYVPEPMIKAENEITLLIIPLGESLEASKPPLMKAYDVCKKTNWKLRL